MSEMRLKEARKRARELHTQRNPWFIHYRNAKSRCKYNNQKAYKDISCNMTPTKDELGEILRTFDREMVNSMASASRNTDVKLAFVRAEQEILKLAYDKACGAVPEKRELFKESVYLQYDKGYNHSSGDCKRSLKEVFGQEK